MGACMSSGDVTEEDKKMNSLAEKHLREVRARRHHGLRH